MSDNPFEEDSDRTVMRPAPGGRRATPPPPAGGEPGGGFGASYQQQPAAPAAAAPAGVAEGAERITLGGNPLTAAAAPLLQLLARLRNTVSQPDPADLRERATRELRQFEQRARDAGIPMEQLRPAHYALCASIDDVVLNTPWGSTGVWDSRSLVSTFHKEVRSGERFFALLGQVRQNPGTWLAVLELMYLCLSLGFMGRYRLSPRGASELEKLREDLYAIIMRQRQAAEPALSPHWEGAPAPYRPARASVPIWVGAVLGIAIVAGLFAWFSSSLNAKSDDLLARMLAAPPTAMPTITRAAAVVRPPPPPPPPPGPQFLDKLRKFLAPEIKEGLVVVLGTDQAPLVRIRNKGMFPSGSATVEKRFYPLLHRIGEALKTEKGPVTVIGHTDNQPIHTVQFPSNFALSTARAKAAMAIIEDTLGNPGRIKAEGRADAEPIASNKTAEGREANRRIEVLLQRQGS